ncbi:MAG: SDR family oxidoreductase [Phaeodactylibacter sp.]|uniref:SDR family oxidoreductase n=1 Tax=Phaeodactylibacter sp. TaxID=1940289 RepID=UPI0032EE1EB1
MEDQNKKVALITGSSMGIGLSLARLMAQQGVRVVLNARNAGRLQHTLQRFRDAGHEATAIAGDVSKEADCQAIVEQAIARFGRLDILVNNAGISAEGTLAELSPEVLRKVMEVNYFGSVFMTQAALPHLRQQRGSVLFISSAAAIRGIPGHAAYSASKMALTALAESLKIELHRDQVHVGIAYVGFTENDPQKVIYDRDGRIIPQPDRSFIKQEPVEQVAKRLYRIIENRTFKSVFTPLGKLNALMNRLAPAVGEVILRRNFFKS